MGSVEVGGGPPPPHRGGCSVGFTNTACCVLGRWPLLEPPYVGKETCIGHRRTNGPSCSRLDGPVSRCYVVGCFVRWVYECLTRSTYFVCFDFFVAGQDRWSVQLVIQEIRLHHESLIFSRALGKRGHRHISTHMGMTSGEGPGSKESR